MSKQTDAPALRVIPISKPSVAGVSFAMARTDTEEAATRANAGGQGLLAGEAMPTHRNPQFWSFIDHIKTR
jgi:hypothetical protein